MCMIIITTLVIFGFGIVCGCMPPKSFCNDHQLYLHGYPQCSSVIDDSVDVSEEPEVFYNDAKENSYYTLVMVDPDAPGLTTNMYYLHWLVTDVKGLDLMYGLVTGTTVVEYRRPTPPSGTHRYQLLCLEQKRKFITRGVLPKRRHFRLADFMTKTDLCDIKATYQYKVAA